MLSWSQRGTLFARFCVAMSLVTLTVTGVAQAACDAAVGRFISIEGSVSVQSVEGGRWQDAKLSRHLCEGDSIRVGERSRAAVALINDAVVRIDQNTAMRLLDINKEKSERSWLDLLRGAFQSFSRKPTFLTVNTPYLNGSIEGTEFTMRVEDGATAITVFEGVVVASNDLGEVALNRGDSTRVAAGEAPQRRTLVDPRDQVVWALYYPPILSTAGLGDMRGELADAVRCSRSGDMHCAFAALERVPAGARDNAYLAVRASSLLAVGRVEAARADIDAMLQREPGDGLAHALRAVVGVALNQTDAALGDGVRAVELAPDSVAAKIALSYAQQATLQLPAARDTLQQAVGQAPQSGLAWARLAELQLALGDRQAALASAEHAVELEPELSRTQNILGFVALARIDVDRAQPAFERALELDSADPLPRLGLGLAEIRRGRLEQGRADIEAAVALDSNNALLRAYLGKAYFEEKRGPLDAQQYEIARELDPRDPTAYFYNAIGLQTENRPVEALRELDAAIDRNDNRAVYRGRLLLDQDRAARGTSQARIYNDLGFRHTAIDSAVGSVTVDPANASAHRFLSDAYRTAPRHETARVSELQQAQMLQGVNINPIQPSLSDTNLNIVTQGGPANAGFNEFTPLFERNRAQASLAGLAGSNGTGSGEAVVSGVYDNLSLSGGAFSYDTDGYRTNNDLQHEIYNLFAQVAVTPVLNVQAEFQKRHTDYGDLALNFDPANYSDAQRNSLDADSVRLGATVDVSPRSKLLLLYNYKDVQTAQHDESIAGFLPNPAPPPVLLPLTQIDDTGTDATSDQFEGAFIYQGMGFNLVAGAAHTEVDRSDRLMTNLDNPLVPFLIPVVNTTVHQDIEDNRGYVYGNIDTDGGFTWTLGLSRQHFDGDSYDFTTTNPKFGVQWAAAKSIRIRAAAFKVVKPALASNRTLEPTQVAGFNQFFDDVDGTRSTRYGAGIDWQAMENATFGAEVSRRELKSVTFDGGGNPVFDDRDEWTHRAYAYWTPNDRWAVTGEVVYDRFVNDPASLVANIVPEKVRTVSVPLKVAYFHPEGYFGGLGVTHVEQDVSRTAASVLPQGDSSFTVVDLTAGYRLPQRMGVFSVSVHNLLDQDFKYQDDSYREFGDEPSVAPYVPERMVMGRLMLSF
ncbi:MAG: FecR domain-containing protein [Gammaproteobacteria bacterium]|nr:FecR domain-containing protein [Gammaproteobacteria bacterium]